MSFEGRPNGRTHPGIDELVKSAAAREKMDKIEASKMSGANEEEKEESRRRKLKRLFFGGE